MLIRPLSCVVDYVTELNASLNRISASAIPLTKSQSGWLVTVLMARLIVKSHSKKRFVIALKYEGETEYRFIVASDLTWRHMDVARTYTLRWLVEVFIQDWKGHGGWNTLSKQHGVDGALRTA